MKITDNYCDYETSVNLKALAFDEECIGFYNHGKIELISTINPDYSFYKNSFSQRVCSPSWLEALIWLEGQGFAFRFYLTSLVIITSDDGLPAIMRNHEGNILSAIQIAVKEAIKILKERDENRGINK